MARNLNMGELIAQSVEQVREITQNKRVICSVDAGVANSYVSAMKEKYTELAKFSDAELKGALKPAFNQVLMAHILDAGVKVDEE